MQDTPCPKCGGIVQKSSVAMWVRDDKLSLPKGVYHLACVPAQEPKETVAPTEPKTVLDWEAFLKDECLLAKAQAEAAKESFHRARTYAERAAVVARVDELESKAEAVLGLLIAGHGNHVASDDLSFNVWLKENGFDELPVHCGHCGSKAGGCHYG